MHIAIGPRVSMSIWMRQVVGGLFVWKRRLGLCADGFAGQRRDDRDLWDKADIPSFSWMSIRQDNDRERPSYDVVMIGVPRSI
jgi:hypothetical protein